MRVLLTLLVAVSLAASACGGKSRSQAGGSPSASPPAAEETFPVTVKASNGPVTISSRPSRVVSLSPTATEMLFAIGAGPQVAAVDNASNYPPQAPRTKLSGLEPNVEAIANYNADLVVASYDPGSLVKSLKALSIPIMIQPAAGTLPDTYTEIEQLGVATGHMAEAAGLVAKMQREIKEILASAPHFSEAPTYYHELDNSYFTVTSHTFIGQVYSLFGLRNIADAAPKAGSGYPQLSQEFIIQADPDLIFLADTKCCKQSAATVAKRPGWDRITAVRNGAVLGLDDDVASRWGPRVVDFIRAVAQALSRVEAARV